MLAEIREWIRFRQVPAWVTPALLCLIVAGHYWLVMPFVRGPSDDFDAIHLYLPLARELIAQGWSFFADERSLRAPPLSWIYPAVYGASLERIKLGNALLSGVTLLLVFRTAMLMHSRAAGLIAAFLFVACPLMRTQLVAPETEAPFLLFATMWLWGLAEWLTNGRRSALVLSAVGLGAAELIRAPIFYWHVMLVVVLAWFSLRSRPSPLARPVLTAYCAALLLPAVLTVKNVLLFDFPFYALGGGNALYLGNNPLTGGYDPNYLGLAYDVGAIVGGGAQSHLTLKAEHLLGGVAKLILAEKSPLFLAEMHLQKLAAFIFVTSANPDSLLLRGWRIVLLSFAVPGIFAIRHHALRWALAGVFVVLLALHVPVLYTHRYSVPALDPWLLIAASIGLASAVRAPLIALAAAAVAGIGVAAGAWAYDHLGRPMPDVFAVGRLTVWRAAEGVRLSNGAQVELPVRDAPWFRWWNNHVLVLDVEMRPDAQGRSCRALLVSYAREGGSGMSDPVTVKLVESSAAKRYQVGGAPLQLSAEGTLKLASSCPGGASIEVSRLAVYASVGPIDYRERFLSQPPILPVER